MNVLLINTNRMKPAIAPIGLDYLADSLLANGRQPRLLDLCFTKHPDADLQDVIPEFSPDVIGVTIRNTDDCYFNSQAFFLPEIKALIDRLRLISAAPIVLGGVGFSVSPVGALAFCGADFGIAGDGEHAFVALLQRLEDRGNLADVPNLVYRHGGVIRRNPSRPASLADLPPRRRAFVDNAAYFRLGGQAGFETKRGCPMGCVYCADPVAKGRASRLMPPARVAAELGTLLAQGIDHFHTCDSEFNLPRQHALTVAQAVIAAGLGDRIRWYAYCTPTPFDDEMAVTFKRAGCAGIDFGADSGCDEMLSRLGRHYRAEDLAATARTCRRHGIPFMYDLLLGGPGETRATVRETIHFMRRVGPDCVGLSLGVRVYEGTPLASQLSTPAGLSDIRSLYGAARDDPHFLRPTFYLAPELGDGLAAYVRELVAGDTRFFLPDDSGQNANYNYNENTALVGAIARGARGAYWDILRRM